MSKEARDIIITAIEELNETLSTPIDFSGADKEILLYGQGGGSLDSISLVSLVLLVEEALEDKMNMHFVLADEKAMSQKQSPFRSVSSLTNYTWFCMGDWTTNGRVVIAKISCELVWI